MTDPPLLSLRLAERRDADDLLTWRNDPVTRSNSRNTGEIPRAEHDAWLERALSDRNRQVWIAEQGAAKAGTVSAHRVGGFVEVSITVSPGMRGRGLGGAMLRAAVAAAVETWPDAEVRAVVRIGNAVSRRLFERCGFVAIDEDHGFLIYRWEG